MKLGLRLTAFFVGCLLLLCQPARAQTDPALSNAVLGLLDAYLHSGGPSKEELDSGSALANWAILKDIGIPILRKDNGLRKGDWSALWAPLDAVLAEQGFSGKLTPLQAITFWEESEKDPDRFVRLLGREHILDPKQPAQRNRGHRLRESIAQLRNRLPSERANARFEDAGWKFTATSSLMPGTRTVRVAITGSQPCNITGSARTLNLNLKGRLYEDLDSHSGIKVQLLDNSFTGKGCEVNLRDRTSSIARLVGGGEAKLSSSLNIVIQDELVSGRFQVDLVSKQTGLALLTGRAVYSVRGKVGRDGTLEARLIPVSRSGSRLLKDLLEQEGSLTGVVTNSTGRGQMILPVLKDPLDWASKG
ncbi:MAG: hypothetical protein WC314_05980 [Vulcanimicrobiota bacterium]